MNFVQELFKGVINGDLVKLRAAVAKSSKTSAGGWPALEDLFEKFGKDEDIPSIFYLLYQDLKLRKLDCSSSWSEKLTLYHHYKCLLEEIIQTEWLWETLSYLVQSFVACTNEKQGLLQTTPENLQGLNQAELETFKQLYDFTAIRSWLETLATAYQSVKDDPEAMDCYYVARTAGLALFVSVNAIDKVSAFLSEGIDWLEHLPHSSARASVNYARGLIYMLGGNFSAALKAFGKSSKPLHTVCEHVMASGSSPPDVSVVEDLVDSGLRPTCQPENAPGLSRKEVIDAIMAKYNQERSKQELVSLASIYNTVSLDTLATLSGCKDREFIKTALASNENVIITDNTVMVASEYKQESYTEILKKQTLRAKELLAEVKKI